MVEFKLTKNQRAVANAVSKEEVYRPVLRYVHIRKGLIEAADGYILVQKKIDYEEEEKILLDGEAVRKLGDNKSTQGVAFSSTDGKRYEARGQNTTILTRQSGTYLDTDKLIPSGEPVFKIALSRKILKKLISALDDSDVPVRFKFYGEHSPVKVEIPTEDTLAVLMPMMITKWEATED